MMDSPLPFLYISIMGLYNFGRGHFYFGPFPQIEIARFLYIYRKIIVNDAFYCEAATAASCESIIVGMDRKEQFNGKISEAGAGILYGNVSGWLYPRTDSKCRT